MIFKRKKKKLENIDAIGLLNDIALPLTPFEDRITNSGVTCVHFDKWRGLWVAQIMFQRKTHPLGRFERKSDAVNARKAGEDRYFEKYREDEK